MRIDLEITSFHNPKLKQALSLRDRRGREDSQLFLIEGYREVYRAVHAGWKIKSIFICPTLFLGENEENLIEQIFNQGGKIYKCSEQVFRKLSYRDRPDGLIAVAPQIHHDLAYLEKVVQKTRSPFFTIAESIEKPGNLGTILRSSDAVGIDALIVCDQCTDIFNPNVVRASVGTLFTVPIIETTSYDALNWLREKGISILAATPSAKQEYTQVDLKVPLAIAVGTEQIGLSELWMNQSDMQVSIPMLGVADSLNVAMATTLLLYEALRQRRGV